MKDEREMFMQMIKQTVALKMGTGAALRLQGNRRKQVGNVDNINDEGDNIDVDNLAQDEQATGFLDIGIFD